MEIKVSSRSCFQEDKTTRWKSRSKAVRREGVSLGIRKWHEEPRICVRKLVAAHIRCSSLSWHLVVVREIFFWNSTRSQVRVRPITQQSVVGAVSNTSMRKPWMNLSWEESNIRLRGLRVCPSLRRPRDLLAGILRPFPGSHQLEDDLAYNCTPNNSAILLPLSIKARPASVVHTLPYRAKENLNTHVA